MKQFFSEEDRLKITIRKNYLERENIKSKILNYLNRLNYLCLDEKKDVLRKTHKRVNSHGELEYIPDFEVEKRPKLTEDETTVTRNKRLLQVGLFEHLKKAKDALEADKSNKTVIMQQKQNKRVEEKLKEEKKSYEKHELYDIEKKITNYIKDMKMIENSIKKNESSLMKLTLISHYKKMQNFISTNTHPTIFWCPIKYNDKIKMLQKNSEEFINKKINAIEATCYEVEFEEEKWMQQFYHLQKIVKKKMQEMGSDTNKKEQSPKGIKKNRRKEGMSKDELEHTRDKKIKNDKETNSVVVGAGNKENGTDVPGVDENADVVMSENEKEEDKKDDEEKEDKKDDEEKEDKKDDEEKEDKKDDEEKEDKKDDEDDEEEEVVAETDVTDVERTEEGNP
ncbi:conserved protein, unknown function [Hepatocystis sp. ex Piliocolobus tephrosceles]|nr:conserved protein, unknown function [Hepatocystis sp. ex Piliocolobus tephrosceles]